LKLPLHLRGQLSRPYGYLFINVESFAEFLKDKEFVTVGDVVTETAFRLGLRPQMALVDGKTKRVIAKEVKGVEGYEVVNLRNEAGLIRVSAIERLRELISSGKKYLVVVEGEEDLLVIPLVLYLKEGTYVVYGQPNAGVVALEVNEFSRIRVKSLLESFQPEVC
jgi:hypothetical protein